jgi:hypothetical protein
VVDLNPEQVAKTHMTVATKILGILADIGFLDETSELYIYESPLVRQLDSGMFTA